jgi:hypothetical protein
MPIDPKTKIFLSVAQKFWLLPKCLKKMFEKFGRQLGRLKFFNCFLSLIVVTKIW